MYQQGPALLAPADSYDQSTLDPNLPNSNNVRLPLQLPQGIDGSMAHIIVGSFRKRLQDGLQRPGIHTMTYNLMSVNMFSNQEFMTYSQIALNIASFLMLKQGDNFMNAVSKSVRYANILAMLTYINQCPAVTQFTPHDTLGQLQNESSTVMELIQVVNNFMNGGGQQMGSGYNPQPGGFGNPAGGGRPMMHHTPNMGPNAAVMSAASNYNTQNTNTTGHGSAINRPMMNTQGPATPVMTPANAVPVAPVRNMVPVAEVNTVNNAANQLKDSFGTANFRMNQTTKEIESPHGVIIKPYHHLDESVRKKLTKGLRLEHYDPKEKILFVGVWDDDQVRMTYRDAEPYMEYLDHELEAVLRVKHSPPKAGNPVDTSIPIQVMSSPNNGTFEMTPLALTEYEKYSEANPYVVETAMPYDDPIQLELMVGDVIREELGIEDEDTPLPPHRYFMLNHVNLQMGNELHSSLAHVHNVSDDAVYHAIRSALLQCYASGTMKKSIYRYLVRHLTQGVNDVLKYGLGLSIDIDDYIDDIEDLLNYLKAKRPEEYRAFVEGHERFVERYFDVALLVDEESGEKVVIMDNRTEYLQVGWSSYDIASPLLTDGPVIVGRRSNPVLFETCAAAISNITGGDGPLNTCLRMISSDGDQFEIYNPWLVNDTIMIRKIDM